MKWPGKNIRIESSSEDSKSENKNGDQITIWY